MKRLFAVFLLVTFICGLSGCEIAIDRELEKTPYPVNVANVTVEKTPEKVICLSPSLTELTYELGYGVRLVGRTEDAVYPEAAEALPAVGKTGNIDTAAVIELGPDTVLSHQALSKKEMDALEAAKIQVIVLPMAKSLAEMETLYRQLSLLYAGQLDAESLAERHFKKITDGLEKLRATLPAEELTNGFVYVINPSSHIIATGDTLEGSILSAVFGENAAAEGVGYKIDADAIKEKNPSVVFTAAPYGLPHLQSGKNYKDLDAVKDEKVVSVDSSLFAAQSVRVVEAARLLAEGLYPELFSEDAPEEEEEETASSEGDI